MRGLIIFLTKLVNYFKKQKKTKPVRRVRTYPAKTIRKRLNKLLLMQMLSGSKRKPGIKTLFQR